MIGEQNYSPGEAALICGVSKNTILAALRCGELAYIAVNARVFRIDRSALIAWRAGKMTVRGRHNSHNSHNSHNFYAQNSVESRT